LTANAILAEMLIQGERIKGHERMLLALTPQFLEMTHTPSEFWTFFIQVEEGSTAPHL